MAAVDKQWFEARMSQAGLSLRGMARKIDLDPSALSRSLNAQRRMTLSDVEKIATALGASVTEVLEHANWNAEGVEQPATVPAAGPNMPRKHPAWGALKGTTILMPGTDLTAPTAPEWGQLDE